MAIPSLLAVGWDGSFAATSFFSFFLYWVMGAFAAEMSVRAGSSNSLHWQWRVAGLFLLWLAFCRLASFPESHFVKSLLLAGIAAYVLYAWTSAESKLRDEGGTVTGALAWLGDRSYSLYAVHIPVIMLVLMGVAAGGWSGFFAERVMPLVAAGTMALWVYAGVERPSHQQATRVFAY